MILAGTLWLTLSSARRRCGFTKATPTLAQKIRRPALSYRANAFDGLRLFLALSRLDILSADCGALD
jgi:hypothetical protein